MLLGFATCILGFTKCPILKSVWFRDFGASHWLFDDCTWDHFQNPWYTMIKAAVFLPLQIFEKGLDFP